MHYGIALLSVLAGVMMSFVVFRRRRRARAHPGVLDLPTPADLLPAGLRHLGAALQEPLSLGLPIPKPHAQADRRIATLVPLQR
jgi:hypothetical protein